MAGSDSDAAKAQRERDVFAQLVQLARLPVWPESIESRPAPEPDILCEFEGEGPVAFELVQLLEGAFADGVALLKPMQDAARAHLRGLQGERGEAFARLYGTAQLSVIMEPGVRLGAWVKALPSLVDVLLASRIEEGEATVPIGSRLEPVALSVRVTRRPVGPDFFVTFGHLLSDPTLDLIRGKLVPGRYATPHPRELLAYTWEMDLLLPFDVWLPTNQQRLQSMIEASEFRRLWVIHAAEDERQRQLKLCAGAGCADYAAARCS